MKLSIAGIARVIGKGERTVHRYLASGQIAATRLDNGMWEVNEVDLVEMRQQDESTLVFEKLVAIEAHLVTIENMLSGEIEALQQRVEYLEKPRAGPRPVKQIAAPQPVTSTSRSLLPPGPDDLEVTTVFLARHLPLLTSSQVQRLVQLLRESNRVPMVEGSYKIGKATAKYALDAAGKQAFYEVCHQREGFQACDDCPHKINILT